ncbi:vacuolar membrane-associated protein iml1 [Coniothyrium glycines]
MSRSISAPKPPRVQKLCTLWTHDDNFSREELVFNAERFPELPTAPGTLLQIVAFNESVAGREHGHETQPKASASKDASTESHFSRPRRGSMSVTVEENGSTIPGSRELDADKAYVFVSKALSPDLKSKHPNLQVSIAERIAKVFGFRNRMQVIVAEADEEKHEAHHVELVFRDEYLARADMWRLAVSELSNRTVYHDQKILFMGTIKATIKHIYINGQSVQSGYFSPRSKPIFRSESARYVLFIQMSREMWDFDTEGAGEIMFNKVVSGFLPDLFKRWLKINARHLVTIILFTRMQYHGEYLSDRPNDTTGDLQDESHDVPYRDYYRVVVSDMASVDWINILYQLKKEFRTFLREVSLVRRSGQQTHDENQAPPYDPASDSIVAGRPSSASQGNILEAINLAAAQFAKDYVDRDLVRTGISVIVVTPGTGVFEVDYNMLKLTTDTLIGSGIGIDLVCLSPMPLHSVPLFKYRAPRSISEIKAVREKEKDAHKNETEREDDKTPRQHQPNFGSALRAQSVKSLHSVAPESVSYAIDNPDEWRFAMPYWVDISFWSGTSEEILELTKPRRADKVVKNSRKKGRIFSLRCRLYELQMMGVVENELGSISLPYLEEDPMYPHRLRQLEKPLEDHVQGEPPVLKKPSTAIGSYSSRGDKESTDDQLDEHRAAYKAWMEAYDSAVYTPLMESKSVSNAQESQGLRRSGQMLGGSPELTRGSDLSTSLRSVGSSSGRMTTLDGSHHQLNRERSRDIGASSPKDRYYPMLERSLQGAPRADVLKRQRALAGNPTDHKRPSLHQRNGSGDSQDHRRSLQSTPRQSPAPSRRSSPPRRAGLPSAPGSITTPAAKAELGPRPTNWFLRQISFAGKAAPAKPTLGDATIDISQGRVKPAMLTVEKNQRGAIAERLASTRFNPSEKPSQPIAIKPTSRAGTTTTESLSSDHASRSVETVRGVHTNVPSVPSNPGSVIRDPGSTFLLAGARALGDHVGSKHDLSSSGGAREIPQTLSPTSAIAPWAVLVNPCNPKKNSTNTKSQYRRWHHVFPRTLRTGTVKWRSLCSPAAVPLTHEWFPSAKQLATEYNESPYKVTPNDDDDVVEVPKSRESLIKELIGFRLSHGFQITVGSSVAEFCGRQEKSLARILAPEYMSADGDTIFMSVGNSIHQLVCVAGGEVEVRRYSRKPTTALESSAGVDSPFPYKPYIRTAFEETYEVKDVILRPPRREYNWNIIDSFLAGYQDDFSEVLRFWRARFILIPVEIPIINRRPLPMLAEDSEEEIRLEGIQKLTQLWQRFRYIPPDERSFHSAAAQRQKDVNPLAIEYRTGDPSAVITAGLDHAIFDDADSVFQTSIFSDSEKYHTSDVNLKRLAEDLQGEKGIQMLDRRWHWKLHYNCFLGFDLTSWLQANFRDIETRDEAVHLGNELMNKGLFVHVQRRHQFRDGNFFFQIAEQYRAPRAESRSGWFGLRKPDKSVPSTPLSEGPRTTPQSTKSSRVRPDTADSSSTSSSSAQENEKLFGSATNLKRKVVLSRVMRYDVDPRKRSYRPEIISLHYDRLHSPDNCYHIRLDWMNVTAKLIEDAIVTWATSVEKFGLKLVEVPIAEAASIVEHHPFRNPFAIKLAVQPPKPQTETTWDSSILPPQYSKTDKFAYHKALLRKLNFVLDMEAASAFPSDVDVSYSWGKPDYKYTQFIHRSGTLLAQITDEGNFLLLANRLVHNRAKDNSRLRPVDPYEHKKATTDGSQPSRLPSTPAERANPHRSPFASPLARPVQDSSLLHTALAIQERLPATPTPLLNTTAVTPEQVKDEVEAFCANAELLSAFYKDAFRQAPSPSPRIMPVMDDKIPSLGLPPAISIREASPANTGWALSSHTMDRSERGFARGISEMHIGAASGIAGRRQGSEGSMSTLGKRGSIFEINTEHLPRRQDSHGSAGEGT